MLIKTSFEVCDAGQFWNFLLMLAPNFTRKNTAIQADLMDIKPSMVYEWSDQEKMRQTLKNN